MSKKDSTRDEAIMAIKSDRNAQEEILDHILGHIHRLIWTINAQAKRILEEPIEQAKLDMMLLTSALRDLTRCADLLCKLGCDVHEALARFYKLAPNNRIARDVLTHFDDYLVGIGHHQSIKGKPFTFFVERGGPDGNAVLHFKNPDMNVNLTEAVQAAGNLTQDLFDLIDNRLVELSRSPLQP